MVQELSINSKCAELRQSGFFCYCSKQITYNEDSMKKNVFAVLPILLALALTGCAQTNGTPSVSASPSADTLSIEVEAEKAAEQAAKDQLRADESAAEAADAADRAAVANADAEAEGAGFGAASGAAFVTGEAENLADKAAADQAVADKSAAVAEELSEKVKVAHDSGTTDTETK
jgi:hypothetical protein